MATTAKAKTARQLLLEVMRHVTAVGKDGKNDFDGYMFRGIDGVLNAVGPALREVGLLMVPEVEHVEYGLVPTARGGQQSTVRLKMRVHWVNPDDAADEVVTTVWGEAFDRADKGTAKAHSVALRTAIIQTLCLPTCEPDPDSFSPEIGDPATSHVDVEKERVKLLEMVSGATTKAQLRSLWQKAEHAGVLGDKDEPGSIAAAIYAANAKAT